MPGALYEATAGRVFAAAYDRMSAGAEAAGLTRMRRDLLAQATGTVVELGAGSGLNLAATYPDGVERIVLTEPSPHMAKRLRERAADESRAEVLEAGAERLPLPDASADTVVATLVLCTVDDPEAVLREVARVLKPGGRLLFLEHVRSSDPGLAAWQNRLRTPWYYVGAGCRCNRDTLARIEASPLEVEQVENDRLPKAPAIVQPLIRGRAIRPA